MPNIKIIKDLDQKFDVVLMSAAWMHLDTEDRKLMIENIKKITNPDALVYISLRQGSTPKGRVTHPITAQELLLMAEDHDFQFEYLGKKKDRLSRDSVTWQYVALRM